MRGTSRAVDGPPHAAARAWMPGPRPMRQDAEFLFLEAGSDREGSLGDRSRERCTTGPLARQRRSALARNERGSAVRCKWTVAAPAGLRVSIARRTSMHNHSGRTARAFSRAPGCPGTALPRAPFRLRRRIGLAPTRLGPLRRRKARMGAAPLLSSSSGGHFRCRLPTTAGNRQKPARKADRGD